MPYRSQDTDSTDPVGESPIGETDIVDPIHLLEARVAALESEISALRTANASVDGPNAALRQWYYRSEIRSYLRSRQFHRASSAFGRTAGYESLTIDVVCVDGVDAASLTRPDLFLDERTLDAHYRQFSDGLGAIKANQVHWFVTGVTHRIAGRLARRFAGRLALPAELLIEAWVLTLWSEISQLISARHLARRIARSHVGEPVIIPLHTTTFKYLSHGAEVRGIDLFYLAAELLRRGVPVAFVCSDPESLNSARTDSEFSLQFEPFPDKWVLPPLPDMPVEPSAGDRQAVVGDGIRGIAHILRVLPNPLKIQGSTVIDQSFGSPDEAVFDPKHLPVVLRLPLLRNAESGVASRAAVFLSTTLPHSDLGEYLFTVLGGATQAAADRALTLVKRHRLTEAHICDFPFFESAIMAYAVRANGGKIILWPHGCNAAWPFDRQSGSVDAVNCALTPAAEAWRSQLPGIPVTVIPYLWLPKYREPRKQVATEPLSVVIVSNEFTCGHLTIMGRRGIESIYLRLFAVFRALAPDVRYIVRARSQANLEWAWELSGRSPDFAYATLPPMLINEPNMVFLFVGQLSSALLEGIGRGIPGLYVREDPAIDDYLGVDLPSCVPTGDVDFITREVSRCCDAEYRQNLTESQVSWYETLMAQANPTLDNRSAK